MLRIDFRDVVILAFVNLVLTTAFAGGFGWLFQTANDPATSVVGAASGFLTAGAIGLISILIAWWSWEK